MSGEGRVKRKISTGAELLGYNVWLVESWLVMARGVTD